jgi:hypothetical protein
MFSEYLAKGWYFMNGHAGRQPFLGGRATLVRTFCQKKEYETFVLVSKEILNKIVYEDEVEGFALHPAFDKPYPIYAVALNTTKIDGLLKKYKIDGAWNK